MSMVIERVDGKRHKKAIRLTVIIFGLALMVYGAFGLVSWWRATHSPGVVAVKKIRPLVTVSNNTPDETVISQAADYTVAADLPRSIIAPTIQTNGFIQQVGVDQNRAIATPGNVHVAGWYVHSVKPGSYGLSIIDGHVQGHYDEGIFKRLGNFKKGDTFQIEFGDLSKKTFTVRSVTTYSVEDANKQLFEPAPGVDNQLKLITCGGKYNSTSKQYEKRIIVVAERT